MIKHVQVNKIATWYTMSGNYVSVQFNDDGDLIANISVSDMALLAQVGYAFSALTLKQDVKVDLLNEDNGTAYTISAFKINCPA